MLGNGRSGVGKDNHICGVRKGKITASHFMSENMELARSALVHRKVLSVKRNKRVGG